MIENVNWGKCSSLRPIVTIVQWWYNQLEGIPMHFLYFVEVHESVIFNKVYNKHYTFKQKGLKANFVLLFLETNCKIMCNKFLQSRPWVGKENSYSNFLILQPQNHVIKACPCLPMDHFFITLLRNHFFTPFVLFIRANDQHVNSTMITFTFKAFQVMDGRITYWTQNGSPHVR
jgi:hypothetical protein